MSQDPELRPCGACYACCVWLGIDELKKHLGRSCRHLDGRRADARCSIYEGRPSACQKYLCFWRQSDLGEDFRPDRCGFLITTYHQGTSIVVFDEALAGDWKDRGSLLGQVIQVLVQAERPVEAPGAFDEIRLAFPQQRLAAVLKAGEVFEGVLLKSDGFEELKFAVRRTGTYHFAEERKDD